MGQTANSGAPKSGDLRIETLRGLAILAVVAHHAAIALADAAQTAGLHPSVVRDLAGAQSGLLQALRMPLFTVLSGWVYALKPFRAGTSVAFLQGKIRRILLPLLFVATASYFFDLAVYGDYPYVGGANPRPVPPSEFWILWFHRYNHLWFLHAMLVIFAVIAVIDYAGWMRTVKQWLFWVATAALLPYFVALKTDIWSLNKVLDLLVFFLVGVGINRFGFLWTKKAVMGSAWVVFIAAMAVHLAWKLRGEDFDPWLHFVLAGSLGPICLLSLNVVLRPLAWIGGYSYTIYLYHGFGFAALVPFGAMPGSSLLQSCWFIGLIVAGLGVPMAIDFVAGRIPYVRTLLLGRTVVESSRRKMTA
jgi:glucans biosynthesis protein C